MARRTYTVAAPVTHGANDSVEQRVVGVDSPSLAHRHMMRRVEAGCSDITECTGKPCLAVKGIE